MSMASRDSLIDLVAEPQKTQHDALKRQQHKERFVEQMIAESSSNYLCSMNGIINI